MVMKVPKVDHFILTNPLHGSSIQVVTSIGCTILGNIHCVRKLDGDLLGVIIGGVNSHFGLKIPLHATTY